MARTPYRPITTVQSEDYPTEVVDIKKIFFPQQALPQSAPVPHKSQKWIYKIETLLIEQLFIVSNLTFNVSQIRLVDLGVTLNVTYIIKYFVRSTS